MDKKQWIPAYIECDICTYRWTAVFPSTTSKLTCPRCSESTSINIVRDPITGDSLSIPK